MAYVLGLIFAYGYIRVLKTGSKVIGITIFVTYLEKYLNSKFNLKYKSIRYANSCWKYAISSIVLAKKVLEWLYNNSSLYMERKHSIFYLL